MRAQDRVRNYFHSEGDRLPLSNPRRSAHLTARLLPDVLPQPGGEPGLIERACRQTHHGLSGIGFARPEVEAVEFKEEDADDKSGSLIAVQEGMIADNACGVESGHFNNVWGACVGIVLAGPSQS